MSISRRLLRWTRRCSRSWPGWLRVGVAVVVSGVLSGLIGAVMALMLRWVQHIAYGSSVTTILEAEAAPPWRRVLAPALGALICGLVWWRTRRRSSTGVEAAVAERPRHLPVGRSLLEATNQIVLVGTGASIGRETAPRLAAAAFGSVTSSALGLSVRWRRLVVAAAAGAGLGTVYNVPLAGAVFTLEILAVGFTRVSVVIAAAVSAIAVLTSWPILGTAPTFVFPADPVEPAVWAWALIVAAPAAGLGLWFNQLLRWGTRLRPRNDWHLPVAMTAVGLTTGVLSIWLPAIPGNGKGIVQEALAASGTLLTFAALMLFKPLTTAATHASGATGGFLAPSLGTGAAFGATVALLGQAAGQDWSVPAFALVAAVAMLATTQRAPWFAAAFGWELARPPLELAVPLLLAAWLAALIAGRWTTGRWGKGLRV